MSGSDDKTIKIWNYESNECICTLSGHSYSVNSVAHIEGTKYIVSGSRDKTIKIWNYESNECISTLSGHSGLVSSVAHIEGT